MKTLKYLLNRTFSELHIWIYRIFDGIIPDFTIFSPIRAKLWWLLTRSRIWVATRIRKWQYITNINRLSIWQNCFINRWNIFDNNSAISIWDNCSIGYSNYFITSSHYERALQNEYLGESTTHSEAIEIWSWTWITTGCIILPWTKIWENSIIWAGSVVRWVLEWGYLYAWVPARKIRKTEGFIPKIQ